MPEVEGAGVALHYTARGDDGPAVLVVHDAASDAEAWAPVLEQIAGAGARAIGYDRRGYGSSGAPEPYAATTASEQAEDAAALLRRLALSPALLVGEGFGALPVLDLLVRRPSLISAAVLIGPPLFAFVPEATQALAEQRAVLEDALREGGPRRAVEVWLSGGAGPDALARARENHAGFFADYAGLASFSVTRRELRSIGVPVEVVTAPGSPAHVVAASDALASHLPAAHRAQDGDVLAAVRRLLR